MTKRPPDHRWDRPPSETVPLFEDEVTDAWMRSTIPQFAILGGVAVAATAPFAVPTVGGRVFVLALAATAALSGLALRARGLIGRITPPLLFGLLAGYCVLISLAIAATETTSTAYRIVYLVPVLFTAVFFTTGWRYGIAVLAPVLQFAIAGQRMTLEIEDTGVQIVLFLFVAHFGAVVSTTLRESLRSTRALHTVLEAASGSPLDADIASIGLDAALASVRWSWGAVMLPEGDALRVAAARAPTPFPLATYEENPVRLTDLDRGALDVLHTKQPLVIADIAALRGPDHVLVAAGCRSVVALPLVHHGGAIGVLIIADTSVRRLDDQTRSRLDRVTSQLGLALGSASAFRQATEVTVRLRELNRRKDDFLANVSHELRTPAATIKLVASTLRASGDRLSAAQLTEMYETLERRAAHLAGLIESLLEQAVSEAGVTRLTVTAIDWHDAVRRWAEIAHLQTGREVTLRVPLAPVVGTGDAVKLERVVANLLSNAAKFSDDRTPIELSLHTEDEAVEIEVRDHGVGIAPEDLERIFDRFHQVESGTTRSAGGFGIGLSLARNFVEAHAGTISVASVLGEGSRFTVRLPREQPADSALAGTA